MTNVTHVVTDRHTEILAAAAEIFRTRGYHATSMSDIAEAASMRKPSLYHHIRSKEEVLFEISISSMNHIIGALGASTGDDCEARLKAMIGSHVTTLLNDLDWHASALVELRSLSPDRRQAVVDLRTRYECLIDEALLNVQVQRGRWPGVPISMVRMGLLGMLNWTVFWFSRSGSFSSHDIAESFSRIFLPDLPT